MNTSAAYTNLGMHKAYWRPMHCSVRRLSFLAAALPLFTLGSLKATPVTVQEVGVGANELVTYFSYPSPSPSGFTTAYAGVLKLLVNGVATDGFCIEPFQASLTSPTAYDSTALAGAPKPLGPMGDGTALKIEQLWAKYYSPVMSNETAAGLQIAIWELVDSALPSSLFLLWGFNDYGASDFINWVNKNPGAAAADLTGLVNGSGQDYVVKKVSDGGTSALLLGASFFGLIALRRKFRLS